MFVLKKSLSSTAAAAGVLTLMSFGLKGMGMAFRVYLTNRLGSSGIGLYQLIMSVYASFATFATSGFTVAVSRLAAEKLNCKDEAKGKSDAIKVLVASSALALCMGIMAGAALYGGAQFCATTFIMDFRASASLRILALSMPFMSLSACLKGYFIAVGQIYKPTIASIFEQLAKIAIIVYIFETVCRNVSSTSALCTATVIGLSAGEALSYAFLLVLYLFFSKRQKTATTLSTISAAKSVAAVTAPIAASAYITNILHSVESVLIPMQFVSFGGDRQKALADFGTIRGMTIPMLFFPYAFLGALLSIQVPAVSRLNTMEDKTQRNKLIMRIMEISTVFSIVCGGIFFVFAEQISFALYGNADCVFSTRVLATVTPFMYIETMSDGLLKSIGQQNRTLIYSVINSVFRIAAVLLYIPNSGAKGYLWLLVASNTLSFVLCFARLKKVTGFKLNIKNNLLIPTIFTALSIVVAYPVSKTNLPSSLKALACCSVCVGVFLAIFMPVWKKNNE